MARVEFGAAFLSDVRRQTELLADSEEWIRVDRLLADVATMADLLSQFPELGRELARERGRTMRRIAVRRLPFFVWYRFDPRGEGSIRMSRLFHARQRTPKPGLP